MSSSSAASGHKRSAADAALVESDRDYLQFTPLGGGCEVGRSCHILQFKGKTIMLDCIVAGTLVALESRTSVPIEAVQPGQRVLALSARRDGVVGRTVQAVVAKGDAACIELLFNDGRTLVCTPDHLLLAGDGSWCKAGELTPGTSEVRVGIEYPAISPVPATLQLDVGGYLTLDHRTAPLFCRLIGHLIGDGSISLQTGRVLACRAKVFVGHELDRDAVLHDIRTITGVDATVDDTHEDGVTHIIFPLALQKAAVAWTSHGDRVEQLTGIPPYLLGADCPIALVCEFLGGLFGGDGHTLSYAHGQGIFRGLGFSWSKAGRMCSVEEQVRAGLAAVAPTPLPLAQAKVFEQLVQLLKRAGVEHATVATPRHRVGTDLTEESAAHVKKAKTEGRQLSVNVDAAQDFKADLHYELRLDIGVQGVLPFADRIGFRYCCHKQMRLTAAAAYVRSGEYISRQREVLRQRVRELNIGIVRGLAQAKAELRAVALLHPDNERWLPLQAQTLDLVAPRGKGATRLTAPQAMVQWGIAKFFSEERKVVRCVHTKTLAHAQRTEQLRRTAGQCVGCETQAVGGFCSAACQQGWKRKLDAATAYSQHVSSQGKHGSVQYAVPRGVTALPTFKVKLLAKREAGVRSVYDLSVPAGEANGNLDSFQANGVIVHNCGLHPAYSGIASLPYFDEVDPASIDLILITHFHLDHAAALPYFLTKTAFRGRTLMTHPTKSVYKLILQDYVKVSSISVEETLYTEQDLLASMERIECVNYHQVVQHEGIRLWAYNAGHVLGAAMFMIEIGGVRVLYTGDYSRTEDRHLMAAELPLPSLYPHVLVIEATYGTQTLRPVEEREERFCKLVQEIVEERGGSCLIPVFALGRAQELLLILDEYWAAHASLQSIPIYYASFLARRCMLVYETYLNMMNAHIQRQAQVRNPFHFKHVLNLKSVSEFDDSQPCVILASPGMLQNGVSRDLLELWCSDEKNGCIIAGYAVEGTLAKHIMTEPTHITSTTGARLPLRMSVNYISFSAHADYRETSEFIDTLRPQHCLSEDTEVLTSRGFMSRAEVFAACPELAPRVSTAAPVSDYADLPFGGAVHTRTVTPLYWTPSPAERKADEAAGIRYEQLPPNAGSAVQLRDEAARYGRQCGLCSWRVWSSSKDSCKTLLSRHNRSAHSDEVARARAAAPRTCALVSVTSAASASSTSRPSSLSLSSSSMVDCCSECGRDSTDDFCDDCDPLFSPSASPSSPSSSSSSCMSEVDEVHVAPDEAVYRRGSSPLFFANREERRAMLPSMLTEEQMEVTVALHDDEAAVRWNEEPEEESEDEKEGDLNRGPDRSGRSARGHGDERVQPPSSPSTPLLFASLDPSTGHLVYQPATALVYKTVTSLVEFTHHQEAPSWADDADEYGLTPAEVERMKAQSDRRAAGELLDDEDKFRAEHRSNGVSLLVDRQHDVYARVGMTEPAIEEHISWAADYVKVKAGSLVSDDVRQRVRMTGQATAGLDASADTDAELPFVAALRLSTTAQIDAFLWLYGYWLGDGYLDANNPTVGFCPKKSHDQEEVKEQLEALGFTVPSVAVRVYNMTDGRRAFMVTERRWVDYFFGEYGPKYRVASVTSSRSHTHTGLCVPLPKSVKWSATSLHLTHPPRSLHPSRAPHSRQLLCFR